MIPRTSDIHVETTLGESPETLRAVSFSAPGEQGFQIDFGRDLPLMPAAWCAARAALETPEGWALGGV